MALQLFDFALSGEGGALFAVGFVLAAIACTLLHRQRPAGRRAPRAALDELPLRTWALDESGTVLRASEGAPGPVPGAMFAGPPWSPEEADRIAAALAGARATGRGRVTVVAAGGDGRPAVLEIAPRTESGRPSGWWVQMCTAEESSSAPADPGQARLALVGRLAAGTVHEFNNILTSVLGYAELLRRQLPEDAPERVDVDEIRTAARQGSELTRRLLGFARGRTLVPAPVDLADLFESLLRLLESSVEETVTLSIEHELPAAHVLVDVHGLENLFVDLFLGLRPAACPGGDQVRVTIGRRGAAAPGRGAPEEIVLHFERDLPAASRAASGAGGPADLLDPAAFERFEAAAQALGGRLSRFPGSFEFALPGIEPVNPEAAAAGEALEVGDGERVLVVEDDWLVRRLVSTGLRSAGFRVIDAASTQEALAVLDEHGEPPELLVADVVLPGIGGVELAERLRERFPRLRVLFISGYGEGAGAGSWDRIADAAFLAKPFAPAELIGRIRSLMGNRGE